MVADMPEDDVAEAECGGLFAIGGACTLPVFFSEAVEQEDGGGAYDEEFCYEVFPGPVFGGGIGGVVVFFEAGEGLLFASCEAECAEAHDAFCVDDVLQ